jgi:hypothetical protein
MISQATWFGGARYTSSGSSIDLNWYGARVHTVAATAGSLSFDLPPTDAHALGKGGPVLYVLNVGANSFALRDDAGGAVATVPAGDAAVLAIKADGTWGVAIHDVL